LPHDQLIWFVKRRIFNLADSCADIDTTSGIIPRFKPVIAYRRNHVASLRYRSEGDPATLDFRIPAARLAKSMAADRDV
jgi:hypothetical protein